MRTATTGARAATAAKLAMALLALPVTASPALAQLTISAPTMTTNGSFRDFTTGELQFFSLDNKELTITGTGGLPRLTVGLNSFTTPGGGFFFLHNLVAQGAGEANMTTNLSFTITNNTSDVQFLRFDSLITPGHIAVQGRASANLALFRFAVDQIVGSNTRTLYWANGYVDTDSGLPDFVETSDTVEFSGFSSYSGPDRVAFDWGATPLNLALNPIFPGQTHRLRYTSTTNASGGGVCLTLLGCEGVQVAFGDPRNDGSVGALRVAAFNAPQPAPPPLIGRAFGPYEGFFAQIVSQGAPLPPALPPPPPAPDYSWLPPVDSTAGGIPEPASWLMLITGFGMAGVMLRRQRRAVA